MLDISLGKNKLKFPTDAKEVKLGNFYAFMAKSDSLFNWFGKQKSFGFQYHLEYVKRVLECLYVFCESEYLEEIETGSLRDHLLRMSGEKKLKDLDLPANAANLFSLFDRTRFWVKEYYEGYQFPSVVNEDLKFKYKGKKYRIKGTYRDAITKKLRYESRPAGEVVEAAEVVRRVDLWKKQNKVDDGSFLEESTLQMIAITARTKKEDPFPVKEAEINPYINERVKHFQDISMYDALRVYDFFFGTSRACKAILDIITSLTPPSTMDQLNTQPKQ